MPEIKVEREIKLMNSSHPIIERLHTNTIEEKYDDIKCDENTLNKTT
jgi:hypothetical protein